MARHQVQLEDVNKDLEAVLLLPIISCFGKGSSKSLSMEFRQTVQDPTVYDRYFIVKDHGEVQVDTKDLEHAVSVYNTLI